MRRFNLQLFADDNINNVAALDNLLNGNTDNNAQQQPQPDDGQAQQTDNTAGGDPNLESSKDNDQQPGDDNKDEGAKQKNNYNAAMARMRVENTQYTRTLQQLAQALGIQEQDPRKLGDVLINMAQEKLAKDAKVPVELYKELHTTKEQLAAVQYQQNQITAKNKFMAVKEMYKLEDKDLLAFAQQLDNDGINLVENPDIDVEYEYYKRNRDKIEQQRIAKAVEEALKNSQQADSQSTTPSKQQGAPQNDNQPKVNNVAALNALLDGK